MTGLDVADRPPPRQQLALTARLNTSALDSRRGVVRLHPEAIAALGIREWDAVALTGSRTTAAVAGVAPAGTPAGTALLDDVTLSNAGLRENTTVLVAPVTVYGARSVTVRGSNLATQSISSATLRQALLGKVMTVGDTVSLLPRELGPDIPTSEASSALASAVGITWTSELLTVTGVDPAGPVSVQPNSVGQLGRRASPRTPPSTSGQHVVTTPAQSPAPAVSFDDLKGSHAQAGRLTEWLKLALDEPELLENPWRHSQSRCAGVRACRCRQGHHGPDGVRGPAPRRTGRARGGCAARRGPARQRGVGGGDRARRWRRAADHRHRRAAARHRRTGGDADPDRAADRGGDAGRGVRRDLGGSRITRCPDCAHPTCATASSG